MSHYPHLFSPLTINGMTIKNRIIMPPMGTNLASLNGEVTQNRLTTMSYARGAAQDSSLSRIFVSIFLSPLTAPRSCVSITINIFRACSN